MARAGLIGIVAILGSTLLPPDGTGLPVAAAQGGPADSLDTELYDRGLQVLESGDWEGALEIWEDAIGSGETPPDPRIGLTFVEVVVDRDAEEWYEPAARVLLWGLSTTTPGAFEETLKEELERILPIVEEDEAKEWRAMMDSSEVNLANELAGFWIEKDPTPTTLVNERLLEHWQRILHAREKFTYYDDPPYGTDDRGPIYVKFGKPDRTRVGFLGVGEMELKNRIPLDSQARAAMRRYDSHPAYEVWVYEELNPLEYTRFLFGNVDGNGRFELLDGVWDLIPREARSRASARYTPGQVPAAHYLELFYYQDLSELGGRFARRFAELDQLWNLYTKRRNPSTGGLPAPPENTLESYSYRYRIRDRHEPENPPLFHVLSAYEGDRREEIVTQTIRTLRDQGPRLVITAVSASRLGLRDREGLRRQRLQTGAFAMQHTLVVRDSLYREVGRLTDRATSEHGDVSTFVLNHTGRNMHLTVVGETLTEQESGKVAPNPGPPFPGQAHIEPAEPLNPDPERLEVSDLATGVRIPDNLDPSGFLFPLLPTPRIWRQDPLLVYLEIYHLNRDVQEVGRFRADFRIVGLDEEGGVDTSRGPVTLSVDLETEDPVFARSFFINLRDQELGHYRVEVEVTDLLSGETRYRQAPLEIMG